jgi:hypothetical protein
MAAVTSDSFPYTKSSPNWYWTGKWPQLQAELSSWNEGSTKQSIVSFVRGVTTSGGPRWVEPEERIAVFDNDGTLWTEQPMYFQLAFIIDRVNALAPQHPEWGDKQPFKALLDGDLETVFAGANAHWSSLP